MNDKASPAASEPTAPELIARLGFDPATTPLPAPGRHPLRFSIDGDHEKIPELKKIVAEMEGLHPGLKQYILDELDQCPTNAAELHLKDVEQPDAGLDLHISIRWKHHGRRSMVQGRQMEGMPAMGTELTPAVKAIVTGEG